MVLHPLQHGVDRKGEQGAHKRPGPVDPLVARETGDNAGAKGSSWVDAGSGEVCAANVRDEDGETDAQRGQEGGSVLLHGKKVHRDDKLRCEEHFDEETAGDAGAGRKLVGHEQRAWEQGICDCGGGNTSNNLRWEDQESTKRLDCADENKSESNLWPGVSCVDHN